MSTLVADQIFEVAAFAAGAEANPTDAIAVCAGAGRR